MAFATVLLNEFPAVVTRRLAAGRWRPRRRSAGSAKISSAKARDRQQVRLPDPVEEVITAPDVRAALARLSPEARAIITVMYLNQHTAVETAEILGIPVTTVNFRSYYALRALRAALRGTSSSAPADRA